MEENLIPRTEVPADGREHTHTHEDRVSLAASGNAATSVISIQAAKLSPNLFQIFSSNWKKTTTNKNNKKKLTALHFCYHPNLLESYWLLIHFFPRIFNSTNVYNTHTHTHAHIHCLTQEHSHKKKKTRGKKNRWPVFLFGWWEALCDGAQSCARTFPERKEKDAHCLIISCSQTVDRVECVSRWSWFMDWNRLFWVVQQTSTTTRVIIMPEQSNDYRVVVFGAGGVGKSSLVLRFVKGTFRESYIPTVEDTYRQVRKYKSVW